MGKSTLMIVAMVVLFGVVASTEVALARDNTVDEKLREAFPGGEVDKAPIVLYQHSKRLLIAAEQVIIEADGKVKLVGCAIARFQASKKPGKASPPTVIRCQFARIKLDRPAHSTDKLLRGKIVSVELSGGVRLRFEE
ncbi:MAG TPA: hypothetical protein VMG10_02085 [Gemmataceae bacterium]|nr:hypothetical protein [Gemmataceae bacterium]